MAHFAQINSNNIVERVVVINNIECIGDDGIESEQKGIEFCKSLFGQHTTWLQTSYNTHNGVHLGPDGLPDGGTALRKNYACVGYRYDKPSDAFIPPQPFMSWLYDETIGGWKAPIEKPNDGKKYVWSDYHRNWCEYVPIPQDGRNYIFDEPNLIWVLKPTE